jgi:hypothetical protein
MSDSLRDKLLRTRAGYLEEQKYHRFLLDSYAGSGGFRGRIKQCDHELGSAATCYPIVHDTYLDRYPREDSEKFNRRIEVATYLNFVEALTDLKIAFMLAKPFSVENLPDSVREWRRNVDGQGTTLERMRQRVTLRSAVVGWCPTVVEMPDVPEGTVTAAQARAVGVTGPKLVPLFPANLTEWESEDASFVWAKVKTDHVTRPDPLGDERRFSRVTLWTSDSFAVYEIPSEGNGEPTLTKQGQNRLGQVPITICRQKEAQDSHIIGLPMHGQVALVSRRLFNLCSELDENLRSHAFPILVLARPISQVTGDTEEEDDLTIGTENALELDQTASRQHYFLAPPADIAASFETRIEATIREIYRMARTEHVRPSGVADATGIARRYAFAATNAAIASFAANVAIWEEDTYRLVAKALNVPEAQIDKIRVIAPTDFDVEDLDAEIKQALDALTAELGNTAGKAIKMRLVQQLLPNVEDDTLATIEEELDQQAVEKASMAAFAQDGIAAAADAQANQVAQQQQPPVPPGQ